MTKKTPQQRCIEALKEQGYIVDVVERINRVRGMVWRNDLFGGFDLLAVKGRETKAVQVTSRGNVGARCQKIADLQATPILRAAGWSLEVWGYGRTKTKGDWLIKDVS